MLSKPGEARNSTPTYRNRKVVSEETPDDIVRRLQRVPSNKACADCSSKVNNVHVCALGCLLSCIY
jgi:hypothetical protein